jgi:GDPmannose 4,6-dehydratase
VFYASSSLIFSGSEGPVQDESTPVRPGCIYSLTKHAAMDAATYYRSAHGLFVSIGVLYNHESAFRDDRFLSKHIINQTRKLLAKEITTIRVGDLSATTDWGYAPDYARAMQHILRLENSDTFIISSGRGHTVQNWFEVLFDHLGLDWRQYVVEDRSIIVRKKPTLIGNNHKLLSTGWSPQVSFEEMVVRMYHNSI